MADVVTGLLSGSDGQISPSHLFLMAVKGVSGHIVYEHDEPVAFACGYLREQDGNIIVAVTHTYGEEDHVRFAKRAIRSDAWGKGVDVLCKESVLQERHPLTQVLSNVQARRTEVFTPSALRISRLKEQSAYSARLRDGRDVIIRPPGEDEAYVVKDVMISAFQLEEDSPEYTRKFLVQAHDVQVFNSPEHTMLAAFVGDKPIGFVFGFLGLDEQNNLVLYSYLAYSP